MNHVASRQNRLTLMSLSRLSDHFEVQIKQKPFWVHLKLTSISLESLSLWIIAHHHFSDHAIIHLNSTLVPSHKNTGWTQLVKSQKTHVSFIVSNGSTGSQNSMSTILRSTFSDEFVRPTAQSPLRLKRTPKAGFSQRNKIWDDGSSAPLAVNYLHCSHCSHCFHCFNCFHRLHCLHCLLITLLGG